MNDMVLIVDDPDFNDRSALKSTINKYIEVTQNVIIFKSSNNINTDDDKAYLKMLLNIRSICLKRKRF